MVSNKANNHLYNYEEATIKRQPQKSSIYLPTAYTDDALKQVEIYCNVECGSSNMYQHQ